LLDPFVNAVSFADRQYLNLVSALSSIIFPWVHRDASLKY
jgi:hypothetical protein